jgi:high affinity Mn2+ porin
MDGVSFTLFLRLRIRVILILTAAALLRLGVPTSAAQLSQSAPNSTPESPADSPDETERIFPHSKSARWWVSGQFNTIVQGHPHFHAPYSGQNSLQPRAEIHNSRVFTLYTALEATRTTEIFFDLESAGGRGLSNALGLLGLTNADIVRNPALGASPYLARLMVRQVVPLSSILTEQERGTLSLARELPVRRLEFRAGKFALPDFFDVNQVGSDDHLQFMNLTLVNNAAYDYAGTARGYTYGFLAEYDDRLWAARFAEAFMPTIPNSSGLDWNLRRAQEENLELEFHPSLFGSGKSAVRLLSFASHGNRGDYREAVAAYLSQQTSQPDLIGTRQQGRPKFGFGANIEQDISSNLRAFARFSWESSKYESYEINQSASVGMDYLGNPWHRPRDRIGAALVTNAISRDVQAYLRDGGMGLLLGDGALNYGRESIVESYYTTRLGRGLHASADLQHVTNPGYNRDRGPVWVPSLRFHMEF